MAKIPHVKPTNHTGLLLFGGTALLALRLYESGKLKRAWGAAINGPGTSPKRAQLSGNSSSGALPSDTGQATFGGPGTGGAGSQFGLHGVTSNFQQTNPKYTGPDHSLVPDMVAEWNYLLPAGSRESVTLPPGSGTWTETAVATQPGLPGYETWLNRATGAVLSFLHLSGLAGHVGATAQGGQVIGTSGWPTDPSGRFGPPGPGNAHLAVIANRQGDQYLTGGWS